MKYLPSAVICEKTISFPVFFPDATRAVIRSIDSQDLLGINVEGLIVNTYHLMSQPGQGFLKAFGGVKKFMDWPGFVISDSGGFQLLSMIYQNNSLGSVTDNGIHFRVGSTGGKKGLRFTPEKCIEMQFNIGSDVIVCLDDCPRPNPARDENEQSVKRTIAWARRCKKEYLKLAERRKLSDCHRPYLLAIIQGGNDKDQREYCAGELVKIGFDLYGFGGWPLDKEGKMNLEILKYTAGLMPEDKPKYALGVGNPQAIVDCTKMGYNIFDCVLPTRDGRHRRLYVFRKDPRLTCLFEEDNVYGFVHIMEQRYTRDKSPVSDFCDCFTCRNYSRAYLQHLFKIEDATAGRLATIHNLRTYTLLTEALRRDLKNY